MNHRLHLTGLPMNLLARWRDDRWRLQLFRAKATSNLGNNENDSPSAYQELRRVRSHDFPMFNDVRAQFETS